MNTKISGLVVLLAVMALSVACNREEASAQPAPAVKSFALVAAAASPVEQSLASYENVRAKLAKDDVAGITIDVGTLETAAGQAAAVAGPDGQPVLMAIAQAAKALKDMPKTDADAVRKAFGELSQRVVTLLVAVPALRQGRFVFRCPMAQGYQKWIQSSGTIDNPYMGKKMLTCGSASDWSV